MKIVTLTILSGCKCGHHERVHSRFNRSHHCGGSSIRFIMGSLHMGSNIEKYKLVFYRNEKIMHILKGLYSIIDAQEKQRAITSVIPIDITVKIVTE